MAECYSSPRNQSMTVLMLDEEEAEALGDLLDDIINDASSRANVVYGVSLERVLAALGG